MPFAKELSRADSCLLLSNLAPQVLAEEGKSKAIAFDEIDKAPEEKARGITIATAHGARGAGLVAGVVGVAAVVCSG